jgi:phospho-N-acetylmuramoyl-pentapeptide-transferase
MASPLATAALAAAVTFLVLVPLGPAVIAALLARGIGKSVRDDEPDSHRSKSGTATMGGLYFLAWITAVAVIQALTGQARALLPLVAMLSFGALGAYDDLRGLKASGGEGWLARVKFWWQWAVALAVALVAYWGTAEHPLVVPLAGSRMEVGAWFIPVAALLMVFFSNAVNLADGLDGLAAGTSAIAYGAYGLLAGSEGDLALFSLALVGSLLAFLWYNVRPARLFMGDTGSLSLGAGLAMVAMLTGQWPLLPLIGIVFVAEAVSVMVQVTYFKYTRRRYGEGRRVFRMSPLHYHFELGGWAEVTITQRFWIVAAVAAAAGVALGVAT